MNCTVLQRRLLASEQPEQLPDDIESHLAQCPSCRAWQRRLVQMERHIRALPVPSATAAKAELFERILGSRSREGNLPRIADRSAHWRSSLAPGPKERGLRKVSVAFALAASLLVFALTWWTWPHNSPTVAKRTDDDKVHLEERLAKVMHGDTAKERVLRLADLAKEVHDEAEQIKDNNERLEQYAQFYTRVVRNNLIALARQLSEVERTAVLPQVRQSLIDTESKASRRAAELRAGAPQSAASFAQIALVSHRSEQDLRALMKG